MRKARPFILLKYFVMNKIMLLLSFLVFLSGFPITVHSQHIDNETYRSNYDENCTTIMVSPLASEDGLFLIEELQKIALQRCSTAREAIALIGQLAEEYGYADRAECITVADPVEVWHMEIAGSGKGKPSAIWSFREANRLATVNWSRSRGMIEAAVREFEMKALEELPLVEKKIVSLVNERKNEEAQRYVTDYTNNFAYAAMKRWEELKVTLWRMFGRGF